MAKNNQASKDWWTQFSKEQKTAMASARAQAYWDRKKAGLLEPKSEKIRTDAGKLTGSLFTDADLLDRLSEDFFSTTAPANESDCLLWTDGFNKQGYGMYFVPKHLQKEYPDLRVSYKASRLVYVLSTRQPIPKGLIIRHHVCDNPPCVKFKHLLSGSHQDNADDMKTKGRALYGDRNHATSLCDDLVREMRERYEAGGISMPKLGKDYGITYNAVYQIIHRQTWKHVL